MIMNEKIQYIMNFKEENLMDIHSGKVTLFL